MKSKYKTLLPLLGVFAAVTVASAADVPAQPIAKKGASVFSDDFERSELGAKWRVTTPTFVIADGVLKCSQTKPTHGAVGRVDIAQKDLVLDSSFASRARRTSTWCATTAPGRIRTAATSAASPCRRKA